MDKDLDIFILSAAVITVLSKAIMLGISRYPEFTESTSYFSCQVYTPWQFRSCTLVGLALIWEVPLAVWLLL